MHSCQTKWELFRALSFIRFQEIVRTGHSLADYISTDVLLQVIEECLKTTIETGRPCVAAHKSKRIVHCLRLATVASREDTEFRTDLLEVITPALCGHLAEFQLISNPIVSFAGFHSKNSEHRRLEDNQRWQGVGAQILFGLINFLRLLEQYSKAHREQCLRLLKVIIFFIGWVLGGAGPKFIWLASLRVFFD